MARHFVDTSALVKLYRNEPQSAAVRSCITPADALVLGGIAFLEFQSAFFGLVRQQLLSAADAQQRIGLLALDLPNFELIALTQAIVASAEQLLTRFALSQGLDSVRLNGETLNLLPRFGRTRMLATRSVGGYPALNRFKAASTSAQWNNTLRPILMYGR